MSIRHPIYKLIVFYMHFGLLGTSKIQQEQNSHCFQQTFNWIYKLWNFNLFAILTICILNNSFSTHSGRPTQMCPLPTFFRLKVKISPMTHSETSEHNSKLATHVMTFFTIPNLTQAHIDQWTFCTLSWKKRTFVQDERFSHKMYKSRVVPTLRRGLD